MLLLHAIARADGLDAPTAGLRARPLCRLDASGLAAFATIFDSLPTDLGRADLLANHELVSQLGDCLPVRFPAWFEDAPAVRAYLDQHAAQLSAELDRLRGLSELAVTVVWTAPDAPAAHGSSPATGTEYLRERQRRLAGSEQRRRRADELREQLERAACGDWTHRPTPSASVALSSAVLIRRASAVEIRARLLEALGTQRDVRILVNGPWPPYTFVSAEWE